MGGQEVSKPVVVVVIAVTLVVLGMIGWYLMRPQPAGDTAGPPGGPGMGGTAIPAPSPSGR